MPASLPASQYPRVLIVGGPYAQYAATIATLRSLFADWPPDRLAHAFFDLGSVPYADRLAEHVIRVPLWAQPLYLAGRRLTRQLQPRGTAGANAPGRTSKSVIQRLKEHALAMADISPVLPGEGARTALLAFRPQIVYTLLASARLMSLSATFARWGDCAVVPHFMDDWPTTIYAGGELAGVARAVALSRLGRIARRAPVMLCISQAMAHEYAHRFARPCVAFMNCVDTTCVDQRVGRCETEPFVFGYVGNIGHERAQMIARFARTAATVRCARPVLVRVYTDASSPEQRCELEATGNVAIQGALQDSELPFIRAEIDAFLHFDSFEPRERQYFRLSLSTKIPLYMSCGLPILAVGPADVCSMQYVQSLGAGLCVHSECPEEVGGAISLLVDDAEQRRHLGSNGLRAATENHGRREQRQKFRETLLGHTSGRGS